MKKLAVITSHPIQYNAPLFRLLSVRKHLLLKVFYTWGQTESGHVYDPDFKREFSWDIPLLDGYESEFIHNYSKQPGAGHYKGIINKNLEERVLLYQPDAVLIIGWSFQSHLKALLYFKGKLPVLFCGDSTLLDEMPGFNLKKMIRRMFLSWVYRHIDWALYTGEANKLYFLKHGVREDQLVFGPHAIDDKHFADTDGRYELEAKKRKRELGIPADAFVFLFAGKMEPKKNPLLLCKAFKKLNNQKSWLILVGNGHLEQELKYFMQGDDRVCFLDFQNQSQMPVIYRMADVFVLPSAGPGETWGLAVNEAMACGKVCIISSKCGCAEDLGIIGQNRIFQSGNLDQLVEAMKEAMSAPDKNMIPEEYYKYSIQKLASSIESVVCS